MTATKARARVKLTADAQAIATAKAAAGRGCIEVIGPPFGASLHEPLTGSDRHIPADEGAGIPGSRMFTAWLLDLAEEYDAQLVVFQASAVQHAVEHSSLDAVKAGLKPLADAGLPVCVNMAAIAPQPAPTPPPALPAVGEKVGTFKIGRVVQVPSASLHALGHELATIGRAVTLVSFAGPDRLLAQRHGSVQSQEFRLFGYRTGQPAAAWLRDVVLSLQPRLLIVDGEAIARAELELAELALSERIAVAVLPAPTNPGHTTLKED